MSGILTFTNNTDIDRIVDIELKEIFISNRNQCMTCDPKELQKIAIDAEKNGINEPLTVEKSDKGYQLISGLNNYYAAKLAGIAAVPCIIIDKADTDNSMMNQIQIIHNNTYDFFKEAEEIEKLISLYGMTQEDAASHLGKAQSTVANKLRLLRLTEEERKLIIENHLTERHARALLRLAAPQERMYILNMVIKHGFNVEKTELAVDKVIGHRNRREPYRKRSRSVQSVKACINMILKSAEILESSGFNVNTKKTENDDYLELTVRIPNNKYHKTEKENKYSVI